MNRNTLLTVFALLLVAVVVTYSFAQEREAKQPRHLVGFSAVYVPASRPTRSDATCLYRMWSDGQVQWCERGQIHQTTNNWVTVVINEADVLELKPGATLSEIYDATIGDSLRARREAELYERLVEQFPDLTPEEILESIRKARE